MQAQPTAARIRRPGDARSPNTLGSGVRVADGFSVKISVTRGRLRIEDGLGRDRRSDLYSRASCPFRRLLILGHTGYISLEAVRWCHDLGIGIAHFHADRTLLMCSARREVGTARLRRAQALAAYTQLGVDAAKLILTEKVRGQAGNLDLLDASADVRAILDQAIEEISEATSLEGALDAESRGALAYWTAWHGVSVRFRGKGAELVPAEWSRFGQRVSPVSGSRRLAANPVNALLNYGYTLLEAETTLALHASALDPALGIWHTDQVGRDSLALDVMEAARPIVDAHVVTLLREISFKPRDFHETRSGVCRLVAPLTHRMVELMPILAARIEPVVLQLSRILDVVVRPDEAAQIVFSRPRRLEHRRTQVNHKAAPPTVRGCRRCGQLLDPNSRDAYCVDCAPERPAVAAEAVRTQPRYTQAWRDSIRRRQLDITAWVHTHPERPDPAEFTRDILPGLVGMSVSALSRQTGLSRRYVKLVLDGRNVPHPLHWDRFRSAAGSSVVGEG